MIKYLFIFIAIFPIYGIMVIWLKMNNETKRIRKEIEKIQNEEY